MTLYGVLCRVPEYLTNTAQVGPHRLSTHLAVEFAIPPFLVTQ